MARSIIKRLSFDIEGNGLLRTVTTIHCIVAEDIDTGDVFRFRPDEIEQGVELLKEADVLIGHNIIGYDIPAIKKLFGVELKTKLLDTLVLSRLSKPNRPMHPQCPTKVWDEHNQKDKLVGPHTLMNLGYYAGANKGDFGEDAGWEYYSEEMLNYCAQDVKVTTKVFRMLEKELTGFSSECIELEHQFASVIQRQMEYGWYFDIEKAYLLESELIEKEIELEQEVHKTFKPLPKQVKEIQPRAKADGTLSSVGLKYLEELDYIIPVPEYEDGIERVYESGGFSRVDWPEFNLGSRKQIAEQLLHRGWKPKHRTDNGNIIVDEKVLNSIKDKFPEAALLADYFMISKKKSMISSWIEKYDPETGRIHGFVNTLGAATRRCTHSGPNLAQVPASKTDKDTGELIFGFKGLYGADCRRLFTVPNGYKQVGCDASGLKV